MQFTLSAVVLGFAAFAAAMPAVNMNSGLESQHEKPRFPVPSDMTIKQAQAKCGDQAQLSCCNKATYAGDTTDINSGLLGGTLSNLIGAGSGADGAGIFDQCSKLDVQSELIARRLSINLTLTLLQSPSSLLSLSRISSTSAASRTLPAAPTLPPAPTTTLSAPVSLVSPLAPFSKQFAPSRFAFAWRKSYSGPVVYLSFFHYLCLFISSRSVSLRFMSKL
jgi:hypothetical protein